MTKARPVPTKDAPNPLEQWPEENRVEAYRLLREGMAQSEVAKATGIPKQTISMWCREIKRQAQEGISQEVAMVLAGTDAPVEVVEGVKSLEIVESMDVVAQEWQDTSHGLLEHVKTIIKDKKSDEVLKNGKQLQSLVTAAGIAVDKANLLRGRPTNITAKAGASVPKSDLVAALKELYVQSGGVIR